MTGNILATGSCSFKQNIFLISGQRCKITTTSSRGKWINSSWQDPVLYILYGDLITKLDHFLLARRQPAQNSAYYMWLLLGGFNSMIHCTAYAQARVYLSLRLRHVWKLFHGPNIICAGLCRIPTYQAGEQSSRVWVPCLLQLQNQG